jgi:hypothetical protein
MICQPVVGPATSIAWRYGLASPLLRAVSVVDAPPNQVAVAYRRAPIRAWVREFASCARQVSDELYELVPGGQPITG